MNVNSTGLNSSTGIYSSAISGNGNLLFNGTGVTTLTGSDSFSGTTSITAGTLTLSQTAGALQGSIYVGSAGTLQTTAASQFSSSTNLNVNGGMVNLLGQDETVGSLSMTGGNIQTSGVGLSVATGMVTLSRNSATITGGLRSVSNYTFNVSNNATLTVGGSVGGYNAATGLLLIGGGQLSIPGTSLISTLDIRQGILVITEGGTFGGSNTSTNVESTGTLNVNNQSLTIGSITGSGAVALGNTGTLTVLDGSFATYGGTVTGNGAVVKSGTGTLILSGADKSTGTTTATAGVLTVDYSSSVAGSAITAASGALINLNGAIINTPSITAIGTINFGTNTGNGISNRSVGTLAVLGGQVNVPLATVTGNRQLLAATGLSFSGATNAWNGQLDLSNNDMDVIGGNLAMITNQIKSGYNAGANGNWQGTGIVSSAAAGDSTHLTALGVIQNDDGTGVPLYGSAGALGLFDGASPAAGDVLIKYTYIGDANLDGKIDGSDYSRIDNGYLNNLTGWYNGDFNYDGIVNGSDYTLMDNAFNSQGAVLADVIAAPTAQIAGGNSVPEPASVALLAMPMLALMRRRSRTR